MTAWNYLITNSTLLEDEGDAWEHLINPKKGGNGLCVVSERIDLQELTKEYLEDEKQNILKIDDTIIRITLEETSKVGLMDKDKIEEIVEGGIDGLC